MDAVSEVLIARSDKGDGLNSMLGASAVAHFALVAVFVLLLPAVIQAQSVKIVLPERFRLHDERRLLWIARAR